MEISVDYQRSEYLEVLYDAYPIIAIYRKSGKLPTNQPICGFFTKILLTSIGSISFFFKKRAVGNCRFVFRENSISRKSKSGDVSFEFSKVNYILVLSKSFLIDIGKGAMPVPYRCFNEGQKYSFEKMYKEKIHNYQSNET